MFVALLANENCNVIAISWESGSSSLSYYIVQGMACAVEEPINLYYVEKM